MKLPIFMRKVYGQSMTPTLTDGDLVIASNFKKPKGGSVVIVTVNNKEVVKRIVSIKASKVFIVGDNLSLSTDSRNYGWLSVDQILGNIIWPRLKD